MMQLEQGKRYRAAAIVSIPFGVTKDKARAKLEERGFTNVVVWLEPEELPANWPATWREDQAGVTETQVWIEATWSKESTTSEDSGTGWKALSVWPVSGGAAGGGSEGDTTCTPEGYTCTTEQGHTSCCEGMECRVSVDGSPRCTKAEAIGKSSSSWLWWVGGALGVAAAGAGVWWYVKRRKHNPRHTSIEEDVAFALGEQRRTLYHTDRFAKVTHYARPYADGSVEVGDTYTGGTVYGNAEQAAIRFVSLVGPQGAKVALGGRSHTVPREALPVRKHNPVPKFLYSVHGEWDGYDGVDRTEAVAGAIQLVAGEGYDAGLDGSVQGAWAYVRQYNTRTQEPTRLVYAIWRDAAGKTHETYKRSELERLVSKWSSGG